MRPIERDFTLSDAKDRVIKEIDNLGLMWRKEVYGKNILTIVITLKHPKNNNQTMGVGKGDYDNAFVGALFEALEHYIEDFSSPLATVQPAKTLMRTGILASDDVLDMISTQPDSHLATRRFASTAGDFYYPLALCDPNYSRKPLADDNFDYRYLARYGSNSGIAIGANRNEALLHGINECIERDALSLFLIQGLYSRSPCTIYEIDKLSLPEDVARSWQNSEEEIQQRIRVLDITQGLKCRTYLALAEKSKLIKYPIGCGTSLHPHHALQRALSELVQINAVFNHSQEIQRENEVLHQRLLRYKKLERCFCMRTADIFNTNEVLLCRLPVSDHADSRPAEDLVEIEQDLIEQGFVIGKSILYETSQVCLTNVLIPSFERFYIITSGNIVLPLLRGRRSLEKKLSKDDFAVRWLIREHQYIKHQKQIGDIPEGNIVTLTEEVDLSMGSYFLAHAEEESWLGRKFICENELGRQSWPSVLSDINLLGPFNSARREGNHVTFSYIAPSSRRRSSFFQSLLTDPMGEIDFCFIRDFDGALPSGDKFWQVDHLSAERMAREERHFQMHTELSLKVLKTQGVIYDPACSTGDFLASLANKLPEFNYIGSDISPQMIEFARERHKERPISFSVGDAMSSRQRCDILILRFLNDEVMQIGSAALAFNHLIGLLNPGGIAFVFGHTPVLVPITDLASALGFEVIKNTASSLDQCHIFQFYMLRKYP